ncbi:YcaO-like family protein [Streptomyces sp. NPDC059009]|uniref:YcaO-like family protein n=1 Tax=Streptomyces sp. NPDC059009 TaxID=3346694 RepID=UPI003680C4EB
MPHARRQAKADIRALGWTQDVELVRPVGLTAAHCRLRTSEGKPIPGGVGSGKGFPDAATTGALYEALEHALTGPGSLKHLEYVLRPSAAVAHGTAGREDAVRILAEQDDAKVACLRYRALDGGEDLELPLSLWAPWYVTPTARAAEARGALGDTTDYSRVLSYSVNSGCAIGATEDEALLHALNEWVERDAFSLFLWRSIHEGGDMPPRIPRSSMPAHLADAIDRIGDASGRRTFVLDLTSDIGVPVALAVVAASGSRPAQYGLGASLSGEVALERAVSELAQGRLIRQAYGGSSQPGLAVGRRLAQQPRLLACAQIACADRLYQAPAVKPYADGELAEAPVQEQRHEVVRRIAASGVRVVAHRLRQLSHGTTVAQVQCPGLERFHLVTEGHFARPGPRARAHRDGS